MEIIEDQGHYYNPILIFPGKNGKQADTLDIEGYATDIITEQAITFLDKAKSGKKPFMLMVHHKAPHRNWMPALRHVNKYDSIVFPLPDTYFTNHTGSLGSKEQLQTIYKDMYEGHDLKMTKEKGSSELAWNPWTNDFDRMNAARVRSGTTRMQQKMMPFIQRTFPAGNWQSGRANDIFKSIWLPLPLWMKEWVRF